MPQVQIAVKSEATGEVRTVMSQQNGDYVVPLMLPGRYTVEASKTGFKVSVLTGIQVNVTETATLNIRLGVGTEKQSVTVQGATEQLETESSALGAVVGERTVSELPLVTRNYTQIVDLYSGVSSEVNNADALGRGTTGPSNQPLVVHGVNSTDNNFQMNGVEINDFYQGSTADISGGVAIPNPDTIAEFKVQTGQYDAAYGRDAGANVDVVTKGGSNQLHGSAFEYFRNEDLDANDYFRNLTREPRAPLRQNQFGFTLGGPIKKDKLLWFTSYQGTKQFNGVAAGCASAVSSPPLTNDRSAKALGTLFAGQRGFFQNLFGGVGPAIAVDGSNINPVALALLQAKLPNGQYVIPTPQTVDLNPAIPFDSQGFSTFAVPCTFNEEQWMINADYLHTNKSKFSARFFKAGSDQDTTLPGTISPPGSPTRVDQGFWNASLSHTYTFSSNLFNQVEIAYHRTADNYDTVSPVSFSSVGATVPAFDNNYPVYYLPGTELGNIEPAQTIIQNTFVFEDSLAYVRGRHTLRVGGGITRVQSNAEGFHLFGFEYYLSWADLLLGLSGPANGTGIFSNVYGSEDLPALGDRAYRVWEGNTYVQDDFRASSRLTLNLGLRYERKGDIADALGRNSNIYINSLNPNPTGDTVQGYVLPSNYSGVVPSGATKLGNEFGINGDGQNTFGPRIGFAWQLPNNNRAVLRGGYGIYYSRIAGLAPSQGVVDPPFGILRSMFGTSNAAATDQNPLPPAITLPDFVPYSPTTGLTPIAVSATMRPPVVQQYSLNLQTDLSRDFLLQIGYAGTRGTKLIWERGFNEASLASASNPIRGQTTNTVANIPLRVPYEGFASELARNLESAGESWYNALEASVSKRFSHGLQFLASYTFGRTLTNAPDNLTGAVGIGEMYGNLDDPRSRYGPDSFTRDQRFIVSYDYELPGPKNRNSLLGETLGGWSVAGVTTIQTGQRLSIYYTNGTNVYGITSNYAQLANGCTPGQVATSGSIQSRLTNYINTSCLSTPPIIGNEEPPGTCTTPLPDGNCPPIATAFGDTRPGILRGPDQNNFDIALVKRTAIERASLEFRTEFFNAFNHPQFANPNTTGPSPTLGYITQTAVAARIMQFALKLSF